MKHKAVTEVCFVTYDHPKPLLRQVSVIVKNDSLVLSSDWSIHCCSNLNFLIVIDWKSTFLHKGERICIVTLLTIKDRVSWVTLLIDGILLLKPLACNLFFNLLFKWSYSTAEFLVKNYITRPIRECHQSENQNYEKSSFPMLYICIFFNKCKINGFSLSHQHL